MRALLAEAVGERVHMLQDLSANKTLCNDSVKHNPHKPFQYKVSTLESMNRKLLIQAKKYKREGVNTGLDMTCFFLFFSWSDWLIITSEERCDGEHKPSEEKPTAQPSCACFPAVMECITTCHSSCENKDHLSCSGLRLFSQSQTPPPPTPHQSSRYHR